MFPPNPNRCVTDVHLLLHCQGPEDVITDGRHLIKCQIPATLKRSGGQGDIVAGGCTPLVGRASCADKHGWCLPNHSTTARGVGVLANKSHVWVVDSTQISTP